MQFNEFTIKAKLNDVEEFYSSAHGWVQVYELATWYDASNPRLGYLMDEAISRGAKAKIISRRRPKPD